METTGPPPWRPRVRILCLHGRQQSAGVFQYRLTRLVAKAASWAEFVFVDGPIELPPQEESERVNTRGWGLASTDEAKTGLPATEEALRRAWAELGPFDGVLGFSEGAIAALRYCRIAATRGETVGDAPGFVGDGLEFGIFAGAPGPPAGDPPERLSLPTLHLASAGDAIVPIAESRRLAAVFEGSKFIQHGGGHGFPQQVDEVQQVIAFIKVQWERIYPKAEAVPCVGGDEEDARVNQEQRDELEALEAMMAGEEVTRTAPVWPVRLAIRIAGMEGGTLRFLLPPAYPAAARCCCEFEAEHLDLLVYRDELVAAIEASREPLGFPSVFAMTQAAQEWAAEHAEAIAARAAVGASARGGAAGAAGDDAEDDEDAESAGAWWLKEEVDEAALDEAEQRAAEIIPAGTAASEGSSWARECGASGYGKPWEFVVGLVGKPSAGKSTFFNAATRPSINEGEASMAPHPFTTIDPNVGTGWFAVPCPSQHLKLAAKEVEPEYGFAAAGQRRYPLLVKDVAGLVPGAYKGRGRGNAFLNDLCEADSLIHVVDASGRSDREGVDHGGSAEAKQTDTTGTSPLDEVGWVRREIHMWIFCNVRAKFDSVRRRARMGTVAARDAVLDRLFGLFTGYRVSQQLVARVYEMAGFSMQNIAEEGGVRAWKEYDLHLLVACFLRARFPITVALNKVDLPEAKDHVAQTVAVLGDTCVPVCAASEWWLWDRQRQGHLTYVEGAGADSVTVLPSAPPGVAEHWQQLRERVFDKYGATGVLAALSSAVLRRRPVFLCPVVDLATYESLLPAAPQGGKRALPVLAKMVMLRPQSSVDEAFSALRHEQLLAGDFVRAEVLQVGPDKAVTTKVLRREDVLRTGGSPTGQVVIARVLTNKKR